MRDHSLISRLAVLSMARSDPVRLAVTYRRRSAMANAGGDMAEYHFVSTWQIQAPIERVWEEIYHAERWPAWWKYVTGAAPAGQERAMGRHGRRADDSGRAGMAPACLVTMSLMPGARRGRDCDARSCR
jgi:hypothetical protein